jgi:hypothetical protein
MDPRERIDSAIFSARFMRREYGPSSVEVKAFRVNYQGGVEAKPEYGYVLP